MRKLLVLTAISALALATGQTTAQAKGIPRLLKPLQHMQRVMGVNKIAKHPPAYHWYKQVANAYVKPPNEKAWLCIHRGEGSWRDPSAPYYGGLQMDYTFQMTYGSYLLRLKGTANHWSPLEQMWVAERARRSGRGFYPWPNTARNCGLI